MVCPDTALLQNLAVSPGLMLRPSLSDPARCRIGAEELEVSPGLMLRPSLSADTPARVRRDCEVSPGLMLRPSLSVRGRRGW